MMQAGYPMVPSFMGLSDFDRSMNSDGGGGIGFTAGGGGGSFGGGGLGGQQAPSMLQNLMALYGQMGRQNNQSPIFGGHFGLPYDPSQPPPFLPPGVPMANTGGNLPPMQMGGPQMGGNLPPQMGGPMQRPPMGPLGNAPGAGYDSSGINPGGMFGPQMMGSARGLHRNLGFGGRR